MRQIPTGRFIPGHSIVHRLDGLIKLISFFLLIVCVILAKSWGQYLILLGLTGIVIAISRIPLSAVFGMIGRIWTFLFLILLMNILFYDSGNPWVSWWIFTPSKSGLLQGMSVVVSVMWIMVFGNILMAVTSPMELTSAFERSLRPLKLFKLPTEEAALIISVAIQFIPVLMEETDMIKKAQIARGARLESRKLHERIGSIPSLVVPAFLAAFRRADELAAAMEARGYRDAGERSQRKSKIA